MRSTIALLVLFTAWVGTMAAPIPTGKSGTKIDLNPDATLYITIMQNLFHSYSSYGESDRYYYMEDQIKKAMEITNFPMAYKIERWPAKDVPAGNPELIISLAHWGDNKTGTGEIEVRFSAQIKEDAGYRTKKGVGKKSGIFRQRDSVFGFSGQRVTDTYNELFRKAFVDVLRELNKSFDVKVEGEKLQKEIER